MKSATARIHGLDTLRALAVSLVVLHHYTLFVSDAPTFGWVGEIGWAGVDLFFALSGYLIGNQIFRATGRPEGLSLPRFYARRLLRTLPELCLADSRGVRHCGGSLLRYCLYARPDILAAADHSQPGQSRWERCCWQVLFIFKCATGIAVWITAFSLLPTAGSLRSLRM